jgi:hypothetical protein
MKEFAPVISKDDQKIRSEDEEDQNIAPHISNGMSFYSVRLVASLLY